MATLQSLATSRADLSDRAVAHLTALVADWGILADLGFSDLVLYLPTWNSGGFVAAAQVRPDTVPTRIPFDVVGTFAPKGRLPQVDRALANREVIRARGPGSPMVPLDREAIPVRMPDAPNGPPIGVIARYSSMRDRPLGQLEEAYLTAADEVAGLISAGRFPLPAGAGSGHRVGDGLMRVDGGGTVTFASPNAQSAMRAMGLTTPLVGADLARALGRIMTGPGAADQALFRIAAGAEAGVADIDSATGSLSVRSLPLGEREGALLLVRDVSELRQRERALLSKDATIREVHHRVKNNLQTVASMLRLQARRMPDAQGRQALMDAVVRVTTIAHVHEALSAEPADDVDFDAVARRLLAMARDAVASHQPDSGVVLEQDGHFGQLPAETATPLAMVLSELLLNAAEHASARRITLAVQRLGSELSVWVSDDGRGRGDAEVGLGLQIVATLVAEQLHGQLTWEKATGTRARIDAQIPAG